MTELRRRGRVRRMAVLWVAVGGLAIGGLALATWCRGANDDGQLGTGDTVVQTLTARARCAATPGGVGYCWGAIDHSTLGEGTVQRRTRPRWSRRPGEAAASGPTAAGAHQPAARPRG